MVCRYKSFAATSIQKAFIEQIKLMKGSDS